MTRAIRLLLLVQLLWLGACTASTPTVEPVGELAHHFDPGRTLLVGFDEPTNPPVQWRDGDQALFGVMVHNRGELTVRYVRITVETRPDPAADGKPKPYVQFILDNHRSIGFSTFAHNLEVEVFDQHANRISNSPGRIIIATAEVGIYGALDSDKQDLDPDDMPIEDARDYLFAVETLRSILNNIQSSSVLEPLFMSIVRMPSILSLIGNAGVDIVIRPHFDEARPATRPFPPDRGTRVLQLPLTILANDTVALKATIDAVPVRNPWHIGAGIIEVHARHPTDPDRWATIRLIAARRGDQGGP